MNKWHTPEMDELFEAIMTLKSKEECYTFFEDVCTIKELIEISQRLKVAKLLRAGVNYATISKEIGVSTATISRVSKCLEYGNGGYKTVLDRLENKD